MTIKINLRRMAECSLCERPTPVQDNAKQRDDEYTTASICDRCEQTIRADVAMVRNSREATS
jgi:hypothetical protein